MIIRDAALKDCVEILNLMRGLAEFEGYLDRFAVTVKDLQERLFERKSFSVLVAEDEAKIVGILVFYHLPFSYDLKPWMYIKELFVLEGYRSKGLGQKLMQGVAQLALDQGCSKIKWDVLTTNLSAQKFYQSLGASHEKEWVLFSMSRDKISSLANPEFITHKVLE